MLVSIEKQKRRSNLKERDRRTYRQTESIVDNNRLLARRGDQQQQRWWSLGTHSSGPIGDDSMGAMWAIAHSPPLPESCGAMPPSRPHRNFLMLPLYTAKKYSKNYECVIIKVKKVS